MGAELTCPSAAYTHSIFPKRLVLHDAVETGPPPQLVPAAHLHNLPTQRLTCKAVDAWPTRFPLNFERFAAQGATSLRQHASERTDCCTGVGSRGETIFGGPVSSKSLWKKLAAAEHHCPAAVDFARLGLDLLRMPQE
jgi:hypothetical protein